MLRVGTTRIVLAFLLMFSLTNVSAAGETPASLIAAGIQQICAQFAAMVSSSEGNFQSKNKFGCLGAFQFCPGTFKLYYAGSSDQFLNSPKDQVVAWTAYEKDQWKLAQKYKLTSLLNTKVCMNSSCKIIDESAILMACQFGCGLYGKLQNYTVGRDCNARNVKDGNGVSVCTYLMRGAGYNVSCFTGNNAATTTLDGKKEETNCNLPAVVNDDRMEIQVNGFDFRFKESASEEALKKVLNLLKHVN